MAETERRGATVIDIGGEDSVEERLQRIEDLLAEVIEKLENLSLPGADYSVRTSDF